MKQVRQDLADEGRSDMVHRVMSYRSGYNADDRRVIERKMFNGELLGIVATTALELGIDIGSLDAVITVGFPYTLSGLVRSQSHGILMIPNADNLCPETTIWPGWSPQQRFIIDVDLRPLAARPTLCPVSR